MATVNQQKKHEANQTGNTEGRKYSKLATFRKTKQKGKSNQKKCRHKKLKRVRNAAK